MTSRLRLTLPSHPVMPKGVEHELSPTEWTGIALGPPSHPVMPKGVEHMYRDAYYNTAVIAALDTILTRHTHTPSPKTGIAQV